MSIIDARVCFVPVDEDEADEIEACLRSLVDKRIEVRTPTRFAIFPLLRQYSVTKEEVSITFSLEAMELLGNAADERALLAAARQIALH